MKAPLIISTLSSVLILTSGVSVANDDSNYPATHFQPIIIYQDAEAISASVTTKAMGAISAYDPQYPAANFDPKVLFIDEVAAKASSSIIFQGKKSAYDPDFPAANFEPKVIYP